MRLAPPSFASPIAPLIFFALLLFSIVMFGLIMLRFNSANRPFMSYSNVLRILGSFRPQVPLRPPCYDFSLVADPRFDSTN